MERFYQLMDNDNSGRLTLPELLDAFSKLTWCGTGHTTSYNTRAIDALITAETGVAIDALITAAETGVAIVTAETGVAIDALITAETGVAIDTIVTAETGVKKF